MILKQSAKGKEPKAKSETLVSSAEVLLFALNSLRAL